MNYLSFSFINTEKKILMMNPLVIIYSTKLFVEFHRRVLYLSQIFTPSFINIQFSFKDHQSRNFATFFSVKEVATVDDYDTKVIFNSPVAKQPEQLKKVGPDLYIDRDYTAVVLKSYEAYVIYHTETNLWGKVLKCVLCETPNCVVDPINLESISPVPGTSIVTKNINTQLKLPIYRLNASDYLKES